MTGVRFVDAMSIKPVPRDQVVFLQAFAKGGVKSAKAAASKPNDISTLLLFGKDTLGNLFKNASLRQLDLLARGDLRTFATGRSLMSAKVGDLISVSVGAAGYVGNEIHGVHLLIDGVNCIVIMPQDMSQMFEAKNSGRLLVPVNELFIVGPTESYISKAGVTARIQVLPADIIMPTSEVKRLAAEETAKRKTESRDKSMAASAERLTRELTSANGKFKATAICIDITDQSVTILRSDNLKQSSIERKVLSESDQEWLTKNVHVIKSFGSKVREWKTSSQK